MEEHKKEEHKRGEYKKEEKHKSVELHQLTESKTEEHNQEGKERKEQERWLTKPILVLLAAVVALILFNQYQLSVLSGMVDAGFRSGSGAVSLSEKDLSNIDLAGLKSTGHTLAAVFPVEDIQTADDAMAILFPTGTPDYGDELDVSFDDPIGSLDKLSKMYRGLKQETQAKNPEGYQRFLNLASKPLGISCEYCCGVGTIGIDKNGNSACGCQHNPALLTIALYLSAYTDYTDGEILKEVMRWKTLFFPKNMIELGMTVAGGDTSTLDNLPGMVGGC